MFIAILAKLIIFYRCVGIHFFSLKTSFIIIVFILLACFSEGLLVENPVWFIWSINEIFHCVYNSWLEVLLFETFGWKFFCFKHWKHSLSYTIENSSFNLSDIESKFVCFGLATFKILFYYICVLIFHYPNEICCTSCRLSMLNIIDF